MPIVVTLFVIDPDAVLLSYDKIKVYRAYRENDIFLEISTEATRPSIISTSKYYNFEDLIGTSSSWYKTSYFNSVSLQESSLSTASKGIEVGVGYVDSSYPGEIFLTPEDTYNINKIRRYIGDTKQTVRDYVSPACSLGYEGVSQDGKTYKLNARGWPLRVELDSSVHTSLEDPYVTDYSFVTFTGTVITLESSTLDVWSESFRHSDKEILGVYNTVRDPSYVSSSAVTPEMKRLMSAITIVKSELMKLAGETSGSFSLASEISYNPEPLMRQKRALLENLEEELEELLDEYKGADIRGVLID